DTAPGARLGRVGPAGAEGPALAAEVPHCGIQQLWILRIHRQRRAAGRLVRALQHERPALAAVASLVQTAIRRIAPQFARHAGIYGVRILRVDRDLDDALGALQSHVVPGVAAIGRLVDAVADRPRIARPGFARADPDRLRVVRIERDRADRLHRLLVEYRLERRPAVERLPH